MPDGPVPDPRPSIARAYRQARRLVVHQPAVRLALTVPRTAAFVSQTWARGRRVPMYPDLPSPRITPALAAQVAMDEVILAVMKSPKRYPRRADYLRVGAELGEARRLFAARGWLDDPASYHGDPPPLATAEVAVTAGRARGIAYERLAWPSGYHPHPGEPGRDRWAAYTANATAYAYVLRHPGPPRPWLVCVHGFGTGTPVLDFPGFRAARLHHELGLNLALPVLPLHGPRKAGRFSGEALMSFDLMNMVFGMAQAMWDIRRLVGWIDATGAPAIGAYGLSLGGYTTALLAALDGRLRTAIAGIPATDIPALFRHHSPAGIRRRAHEHHLLGEDAHHVHTVISPLVLAPRVPKDGRFVFAGLGDRMSTPWQAHRLWLHWGKPEILWYDGNHVGFYWSSAVDTFVRAALARTLSPAA